VALTPIHWVQIALGSISVGAEFVARATPTCSNPQTIAHTIAGVCTGMLTFLSLRSGAAFGPVAREVKALRASVHPPPLPPEPS
jgi:hypothetical protein